MVYFLVIWVALLSAFSPASPVFESCQLRRNFSIAKIQPPQPENSMYGCEMDGWSRREYNFLSCYDSADGNGIVNVNVEFAEGYLIAGVFRLLVVSYKPLLWRVKTNRDIQLAFLTWDPSLRSQLEAVDRRILAIYSGVDDYIGVLPSGEFHGANLSGDPLGETKGATRSFSAGYLVSQFTLVIGEKSPQSGDRPLTTAATVTTGPVESSGHGEVTPTACRSWPTPCNTSLSEEDNSIDLALPIGVSLTALALLLMSCVMVCRWRLNQAGTSMSDSLSDRLLKMVKEVLPEVLVVAANCLEIGSFIGEGQFGTVYEGRFIQPVIRRWTFKGGKRFLADNKGNRVAIKTIRNYSENSALSDFFKECAAMKNIKHLNVLSLIGVCVDSKEMEGPLILTPFMNNKDLKSYLKANSRRLISSTNGDDDEYNKALVDQLVSFMLQICCGMKYLSSKFIVHRDLATRNCMLSEDMIVKIADFGMARYLSTGDYYHQSQWTVLPIKWMAPEGVNNRIFSEKSDVWAFGVTVWETFSMGSEPYPGVTNIQIMPFLSEGNRLLRPDCCSKKIFKIIEECWAWEASDRPTFQRLYDSLSREVAERFYYLIPEDTVIVIPEDTVTTEPHDEPIQITDSL